MKTMNSYIKIRKNKWDGMYYAEYRGTGRIIKTKDGNDIKGETREKTKEAYMMNKRVGMIVD